MCPVGEQHAILRPGPVRANGPKPVLERECCDPLAGAAARTKWRDDEKSVRAVRAKCGKGMLDTLAASSLPREQGQAQVRRCSLEVLPLQPTDRIGRIEEDRDTRDR